MIDTSIRHVTIPGLRLHLRRGEPNMLWINGQNMLLLNNSAAEFLETFIEVMSRYNNGLEAEPFKSELATQMQKKYPLVPRDVLIKDFDNIYGSILEVSKGSCPVSDLSLGSRETDPRSWTAPPRIDLALTYRCNNNCYFCYTGGPQQVKELSTSQWKTILDKIWKSGIPQVVFTGGEPTLRDDLIELVDHAQQFVTGLITNGRKLTGLARDLRRVSLDYAQVSLESADAEIHDRMVGLSGAWQETTDGIRKAVSSGLEVITNTTLTKDNLYAFPDLIKIGPSMGLKVMACNTLICSGRGTCSKQQQGLTMPELKDGLTKALEAASKAGIRLEWYTPTCYKQFNPLEFGLGVKACSAAQYNMTIEPDGSVLPCQSWFKDKLGNILKDPWPQIWNHPVAVSLREKKYVAAKEECRECEHLNPCFGGCPLEYSP
jgi:radical SAM protein with 4Fe4S-binding SPASM domain